MLVNRGRLEIMADILGLCTKPQVKTRIMYHANIAFRQFETYAKPSTPSTNFKLQ